MSNYEKPGIPSDLFNRIGEYFRAIKVQNTTIIQDLITNGSGFRAMWREQTVTAGGNVYAEFTIPPGYYMAIYSRLLNSSGPKMVYRVFPQGTYTKGADKADDALNFTRINNLRQGSPLSGGSLVRTNVTSEPSPTDFYAFEDLFGTEGNSSGKGDGGNLSPVGTFLLLNPDQKFLLNFLCNDELDHSMVVELQYALISEQAVYPIGELQ